MDFRSYFHIDKNWIHLNNAGCTPLSIRAAEAMHTAINEHSQLGYHGREVLTKKLIDSRNTSAKFFGTKPEHIAMTQNCATAVSIVAQGLKLNANDEILTWDQEYPSNSYAWHAAARAQGAKVITLKSEANFEMNLELMLSKINARTRIVTLSWVQSVAGTIISLKPILDACERVGAWFVVDAFQGLGAIPFKMSDYPGIIITTGAQKWMCGPLGHGYLAFSDDRYRELDPILQGALTFGGSDQTNLNLKFIESAARFEPGTPLILTAIGAAASMECIEEFGIDKIHQKNIALREYLVSGLQKLDAKILGTIDSKKSGPHVTFLPIKSLSACEKSLFENKISYVTKVGGLRFSPHAFNSFEELDIAIDCIK